MTTPEGMPDRPDGSHHTVTRAELAVAVAGLVGLALCLLGTALVVFQPGRPTLGSSATGIILFLIGAVMTGIGTLLPGEPEDLCRITFSAPFHMEIRR